MARLAKANRLFREIHEELGSRQTVTAKTLGIAQGSVSNYLSGKPMSQRAFQKCLDYRAGRGEPAVERKPVAKAVRRSTKVEQVQMAPTADALASMGIKPKRRKSKTSKATDMSERDIIRRINLKFTAMQDMRDRIVDGKFKAMIVAGAAGTGKSFNVIEPLERRGLDNVRVIKGAVSAPGLYTLLYDNKDGIIIFDDSDDVFTSSDTTGLNLLKAALDTSGVRELSWNKSTKGSHASVYSVDHEGGDQGVLDGKYPNRFIFNGGIIFITNLNLQELANGSSKIAPHAKAIVSRSNYLNLSLWSVKEKLMWITHVFTKHMAPDAGLKPTEAREILDYVAANAERFNDLSLRLMKHVIEFYQSDHPGAAMDWKELVEVFQMDA